MRNHVLAAIMFLGFGSMAAAEDEKLKLSAPADAGTEEFLRYLLPRFSLKTGIRLELMPSGAAADIMLLPNGDGQPVFTDSQATWNLEIANGGSEADRFLDWLTSEIGHRTIAGYRSGDAAPFQPYIEREVVEEAAGFSGDARLGESIAVVHCGRCHKVTEENRMSSIGSTPSFALLRSFPDWGDRFEAFFTRPPHGAFIQIEDVTAPFDITLPSPIVPLELTLEQLDAILAFVTEVEPANLGAPLQLQ